MGWQDLIRSWQRSANLHQFNPRASLDELADVEQRFGYALPNPLREFYRFSNGASLFGGDLKIYTLQPQTITLAKPFVNPFQPTKPPVTEHTTRGLVSETSFLREHNWRIPSEVLVFGDTGSDSLFSIWIPVTPGAVFNHPIVEIGEIFDTPRNMSIVGTSLLRFLYGLTAYWLLSREADDAALDAMALPETLRSNAADPSLLARVRRWADPNLPDHDPDPYKPGVDAAGIRHLMASLP